MSMYAPSRPATFAPERSAPGGLLTPGEVAVMFRVDPKTVTRWAQAGKISAVRTLGGHRRFHEDEIRALLNGTPQPAPVLAAIPQQRVGR